jgi:hypothetical protein
VPDPVFGKGTALAVPTNPSIAVASAPEVRFLVFKRTLRNLLRPQPTCLLVLGLIAFASGQAAKASTTCIPFSEARNHIGTTRCIAGKVLRVKQGNGGVHFFDFCEDYRVCPFTVVVFPGDLKKIGDLRQLQGRQIEIEGPVKEYDGRAEIILTRLNQLRGDAAKIPPLPKEYDVERHGKYSAGKFSRPKQAKTLTRKTQSRPVNVQDDMSQPMSPEN